MKYDIGVTTETFRHYIVQAASEEEAIQKGWEAYYGGDEPDNEEDGQATVTTVMEMPSEDG